MRYTMGLLVCVGGETTINLLKTATTPDCLFEAFHTRPIDDYAKKGPVWKLRSITPRPY